MKRKKQLQPGLPVMRALALLLLGISVTTSTSAAVDACEARFAGGSSLAPPVRSPLGVSDCSETHTRMSERSARLDGQWCPSTEGSSILGEEHSPATPATTRSGILSRSSPFALSVGLLLLSYTMDEEANRNYQKYLHTADPQKMERYFSRSEEYQHFSTGFLLGAQAALLYAVFYAFGDDGVQDLDRTQRVEYCVRDRTIYVTVNCWGLLDD